MLGQVLSEHYKSVESSFVEAMLTHFCGYFILKQAEVLTGI
jgi:hypothetical protein